MPLNVVSGELEQLQIGQETTEGTAASANRRLQSMKFGFTPEITVDKYKAQGRRHTNRVEVNEQSSTFDISGKADYIEILYAIEAAFGTVAPTTVGVAAKQRVYDVPLSGAITPKSLTCQWGVPSDNVNQVAGAILQEIGLKATRKNAPAPSGKGIALARTTGVTFTASPTIDVIEPILATHLNYYLDTTGAGIGTTQVAQEILTADWSYKGLYVPFWASNRSNASYAGHLDAPLTAEVQLDFAESTLARTVETALLGGGTYFLRISFVGPLIPGESSEYWTLWIDCAVKLTKLAKFSVADQVYMRQFTLEIVEDTTWGHACMITSITNVATL